MKSIFLSVFICFIAIVGVKASILNEATNQLYLNNELKWDFEKDGVAIHNKIHDDFHNNRSELIWNWGVILQEIPYITLVK